MSKLEDFQRNVLLIITVALLYLFISGKAVEVSLPEAPIIIP
ncbi:hypothetical protein [Natronincola peptidivorans]|nr:hypothetical protein [Natronincola peptidivorans]